MVVMRRRLQASLRFGLGALAAVFLASCSLVDLLAPAEKCEPVHQFEEGEPRTDIDQLGKVMKFPARPLRVFWHKGRLAGSGGTIPGGDWELLALLEFSDADAAALTAEDVTEITELEIPAQKWIADKLGLQMPRPSPANPCEELRMRINGFRYDGRGFERYFLKNQAFMKIPGSPFFVLWLSTHPVK